MRTKIIHKTLFQKDSAHSLSSLQLTAVKKNLKKNIVSKVCLIMKNQALMDRFAYPESLQCLQWMNMRHS